MRACLDTYAHTPDNRSMLQLNEPIIEFLRRRLNEHKGMWPMISKETGVEYDTLAKIAQGVRTNPGLSNIQPLLDWFEARDEMLAKLGKTASA
jgi:hypothetical protein